MNVGLRWRLAAIFILVILLVSTLSTAYAVQRGADEVEASLVARQREMGARTAGEVERFLAAAGVSLQATAGLLQRGDVDPEVDRARVAEVFDPVIAFNPDFREVALVDAAGRVVLARPETGILANASLADLPAFRAASSDGRATLGLAAGEARSGWVVPVLASLGTPRPHYVAGVLASERIGEILFVNLPPGSEALFLDAEGRVVSATVPDGGEESVRLLATDGAVPADGSGARSEDTLITRTSLGGYPGEVVLLGSTAEIATLKSQIIRSALLTSAGLAGAAIVVGVVLASRVTQPLTDVRRATRSMAAGDLSVRAKPRGPPEVAGLARDFNAMAEALARDRKALLDIQEQLASMVKARTSDLEASQDEMELFFYSVSHDFRNPVAAISSLAELAAEQAPHGGKAGRDLHEFLGRIGRSSSQLQRLIQELLSFAQASRAAPDYREIEAAEVIREVVEEARASAQARGISLEAFGNAARIETDPARLRHVCTNLVQNAVKYMPPDRKDPLVEVRWGLLNGEFVVRVKDNGAGIPGSIRPHLFRPFGVRAAGRRDSTGLGLSIVNRLVGSLKGRIALETEEGKGTTFTVSLPARKPPAGAAR